MIKLSRTLPIALTAAKLGLSALLSRRLRAGLGLAVLVIGTIFGAHLLDSRGPQGSSPRASFVLIMFGVLIWKIIFFRLLTAVFTSGPAAGSSVSAWRPIDAADRQFSRGDRSRNLAPIVFRISPWPWIKCHGVVVLSLLGLNLLIWAFAPLPWRHQSLVERYMFAEVAIWYAALNAELFAMHYRLLHLGIGAWGCNFRLAYPSRNQIRNIVVQREGSFPLSLVAGIWVREKLSEVLRWKELHYGLTFKDGRDMPLGIMTKTASWTAISGLEWERLLEQLSQRTGVAIARKKIGE
jgi:hypothetical protein